MRSRMAGLIVAVATSAGCASSTGATADQGATAATASASQNTNRELIARTDLAAMASSNLYDVVSSRRPHWLRGPASARSSVGMTARDTTIRGGTTQVISLGAGGVPTTEVYVDGRRQGDVTTLRSMPAESAEKLCYFTLNRAQNRFGMSVESPVIEVLTRSSTYAQGAC